jgi:hypothetical protein
MRKLRDTQQTEDFRLAYLATGRMPAVVPDKWASFRFKWDRQAQKTLWEASGEALTREYVRVNPGRRPWGWWEYGAPRDLDLFSDTAWAGQYPILRQRVGGIGKAQYEVLAVVLHTEYGIPNDWMSAEEAAFFKMPEAAICPTDPPRFESQAAYLRRLNLLLPGERRRLGADAFKPETIHQILNDPGHGAR